MRASSLLCRISNLLVFAQMFVRIGKLSVLQLFYDLSTKILADFWCVLFADSLWDGSSSNEILQNFSVKGEGGAPPIPQLFMTQKKHASVGPKIC